MFAPRVAKPMLKALRPQRSTALAQRPSQSPCDQAGMLQRSIGNQAMLRFLVQPLGATRYEPGAQQNEADAAPLAAEEAAPSWAFGDIPVFCPGRAEQLQMPPSLPAPRLPGPIQAKLKVGAVDDPLEHEADRIADQVMRMPAPDVSAATSPPQISRKCEACEEEKEKLQKTPLGTTEAAASEAPDIVHEVLHSPGQPLDAASRAYFEPRFRRDFSGVRVHTDKLAKDAARSVAAQAFTVDEHIVFGERQSGPHGAAGRHLLAHELSHVVQQRTVESHLQRKPVAKPVPTPQPPAGGNILYVGLNNFQLEIAALKTLYKGKPVNITDVTLATDVAHTVSNGSTFDLTNDAGVDSFAGSLGLDTPAQTKSAADLLKASLLMDDRDDMAHVMAVYALTEKDGMDRMSRVVLSGHSLGVDIEGAKFKNHIYFSYLVDLAKLFPKAAGQTKHLYVSGCYAGVEDNVREFYQKAYPNLVTFSGWTDQCPTDTGAASALSDWAKTTDPDPTTLAKPPAGRSNWASGVYQGLESSDPAETMRNLHADEAKFLEYFNGEKVDPDAHRGWLTNYYGQARTASLRVSSIKGADHDYALQQAEQAVRLRLWPDFVSKFWKDNETKIRAGYGKAAVPDFGKMSRKEALKAIAGFSAVAKGDTADQAEAQRLLDGLKNLDEKVTGPEPPVRP